ncbi:hypothetical protein ABIB94_008331 [Bradyrhizobium sp. JR7.2]|uniref:hypothetical protein n=1 Tax=unclassified Bradyrhizobium TaxID=2631580 RepID=UPI0033912F39
MGQDQHEVDELDEASLAPKSDRPITAAGHVPHAQNEKAKQRRHTGNDRDPQQHVIPRLQRRGLFGRSFAV